mgnify:CR=1 FL=1
MFSPGGCPAAPGNPGGRCAPYGIPLAAAARASAACGSPDPPAPVDKQSYMCIQKIYCAFYVYAYCICILYMFMCMPHNFTMVEFSGVCICIRICMCGVYYRYIVCLYQYLVSTKNANIVIIIIWLITALFFVVCIHKDFCYQVGL